MSKANNKNRKTAIVLFSIAGGMLGLAFASVPLYQLFCQVTGYGGTTRVAEAPEKAVVKKQGRFITVRFDANVNSALPWKFKPLQKEMVVRVGDEVLAHYTAKNIGLGAVVGNATFNVTPFKAGPYFNKVDCFCFSEQLLKPDEEVPMPVSFFVDPEIFNNPNTRDVHTITLSYTFYRAPENIQKEALEVSSGGIKRKIKRTNNIQIVRRFKKI
jgi:cytochrome c oxidase assembly protein subunit 11